MRASIKSSYCKTQRTEGLLNSSASETLFFVFYSVWLIVSILHTSLFDAYIGTGEFLSIRALCMFGVIIASLTERRLSSRELLAFVLMLIMGIAIINSTMWVIADAMVFIFSARTIPLDKVLRVSACIIAAMVCVIVASSQLGIIKDFINIDELGRVRHYLGFKYSLYAPQYVFYLTIASAVLAKDKYRLWKAVVFVALNAFIFYHTDSRLSFYLSIALILSAFVFSRRPQIFFLPHVRVVIIGIFIVFAIFAVVFTLSYSPSNSFYVGLDADGVLGGRLRLGKASIEQYGIPLLGQRIDLIGNGLNLQGEYVRAGTYNYVDSLYIQLLVRYGLIFTICFIGAMTMVTYHAIQAENWMLVLALCFTAAHCLVDDLSLLLYFNPLLFCVSTLARPDSWSLLCWNRNVRAR